MCPVAPITTTRPMPAAYGDAHRGLRRASYRPTRHEVLGERRRDRPARSPGRASPSVERCSETVAEGVDEGPVLVVGQRVGHMGGLAVDAARVDEGAGGGAVRAE